MGEYKFGGVVKRTFPKGIKVAEMVKLPNGSSFDRLITVWTATPINEGATIEVSGSLTVKSSEYVNRDGETKTGIEWNINDALINLLRDAPTPNASAAWVNDTPTF